MNISKEDAPKGVNDYTKEGANEYSKEDVKEDSFLHGVDLAKSIREVFVYINRFKGTVFVIKLEDLILDDPVFPMLMQDIALLHKAGIKIVIVPGSRRTIDKKLKEDHISTEFKNGVRITSRKALPIVELATLEVSQKIVAQLVANGCDSLQGNWIQASSMGVLSGVDYDSTGRIDKININILNRLLNEGFIPIIPHIGWNKVGEPYNINSNEVATFLCESLSVTKLFFVGVEEGIRADDFPKKILGDHTEVHANGFLSSIDMHTAERLLSSESHTLTYSQADYFRNALQACKKGVKRVHLVSGLSQGSLLQEVFSSRGEGTMIYTNEYASIRAAVDADVPEILQIMQDYIRMGQLINRGKGDILAKLDDYVVQSVDNSLHGCGALHVYGDVVGEIAAIAVDKTYRTSGVGATIVRYLLERARRKRLQYVFLLTTQAGDWFYNLGFREGTLDQLPEERKKSYDHTRNSRVLVHFLS
jgi:amino-acid N-acetyltransferase